MCWWSKASGPIIRPAQLHPAGGRGGGDRRGRGKRPAPALRHARRANPSTGRTCGLRRQGADPWSRLTRRSDPGSCCCPAIASTRPQAPVLGVRANSTIQSLRRFSILGFLRETGRTQCRQGSRRRARDPHPITRAAGRVPLRWQPAEGVGVPDLPPKASSILAYEPTQGVDVGSRFDIYRALRARTDAGAALLVKSSDPIELSGLCDRVLVMSRGPSSRRSRGRARRASHRRGNRPWPGCPVPDARHSAWPCPRPRPKDPPRDQPGRKIRRGRSARSSATPGIKNKWRKVIKVRLWMPVALQVLLILAVVWFTDSRFEGFINRTNTVNIL